jgi:hypothetical protein
MERVCIILGCKLKNYYFRFFSSNFLSNFRSCSHFKRLSIDKKLWTEAAFNSKELDIWEILKRLKYLLVTTKTLKIHGNCKKENVQSRPMPNRQTFKEIIKRIVERSPLIQNLHFTSVWFDWTKDVSLNNFQLKQRFLIRFFSVFNLKIPIEPSIAFIRSLHHAENES